MLFPFFFARLKSPDLFIILQIGISLGLWFFCIFLTLVGVERLKAAGATKSYLLFKRTSEREETVAIIHGGAPVDEEQGDVSIQAIQDQRSSKKAEGGRIDKSTTVFTWSHLDYTGQSFLPFFFCRFPFPFLADTYSFSGSQSPLKAVIVSF